jgi:hypothetical protein
MNAFAVPPTSPIPRGRHQASAIPLSRSAWARIRAALTATVLLTATAGGIAIGSSGADVSPVAVPTPAPTTEELLATPERRDGVRGDGGPRRNGFRR